MPAKREGLVDEASEGMTIDQFGELVDVGEVVKRFAFWEFREGLIVCETEFYFSGSVGVESLLFHYAEGANHCVGYFVYDG